MKTTKPLTTTRRACLVLCAAASLAIPLSVRAQALQEVTYLLPAVGTLPAFAPWMLAQAKGYYKAEGLDVKFVAGRGGVDVAKQVGAGNAVIGGAIGDTPIIARAQGIPVKAVAVLGQNGGGVRASNLRQYPQASTAPINVTARDVRAQFGWA